MQGEQKYWFPAKRYGWGWGFPTTWQGMVAMLIYAAALGASLKWLMPRHEPGLLMLCVGALTAALVLVCWLKGEPPSWRWGGHD